VLIRIPNLCNKTDHHPGYANKELGIKQNKKEIMKTCSFTWCGSFTGTKNVLFWKTGIAWGSPGYFREVDPSKSVPFPFRTTKTSSQECLWIGVLLPGLNVWIHTSTWLKAFHIEAIMNR
jgi:hypothetical protein